MGTNLEHARLSWWRTSGIGLVSGLFAHLPALGLARLPGGALVAMAWIAAFFVGCPLVTLPVGVLAYRASSRATIGALVRHGLLAGLIAGAVTGAALVVVERLRTGHLLPASDLAAHLLYPVVAALYGGLAAFVGTRRGLRRGGP